MTSPTTGPVRGAGSRRAEGHNSGLVMFAAVVLGWAGLFNLMDGIATIANSHVFVASAHFVFGSLHSWGWIALILGVLQLVAAMALLLGNQLVRWFGVAVLGLNAIAQMFFIAAYAWWSLTIIAVDVVALYALCAYGSRANADAILAEPDQGAALPEPEGTQR